MRVRRRSGHGASVPGAAVAAALALAVLVGSCSGDDGAEESADGDGTSSTSAPTSAAPGMVPEGAVEAGLRELAAGDCFDPIADPAVTDLAVWRVDCEVPHTHEVYDVVPYEGEGAGGGTPYPGAAVVQDWSEQACFDRFEAFVGVRWTVSELDIAVWWPSEESWGRGDRSVVCAVVSQTGDRLTGSQRGTAR